MPQIYTADEVKKHNSRRSVWMVIRNDVYDVSAFIAEHPGGERPLLEVAGHDATIAFDDVGHSQDAITMMKNYKIGTLAQGEGCCKMKPRVWKPSQKSSKSGTKTPPSPKIERRVPCIIVPREPSSKLKWALLALGLAIIIGIAYKRYAS